MADFDKQGILQFLLEKSNMTFEDAQSEVTAMRNQKYLKQHTFNIWQANDGRYKTHLPDANGKGGRRLIAKSSREALEKAIIDYYRSIDEGIEQEKITLKSWYPIWFAYKELQTRSSMYMRRIQSDYDNYYKDTSIENIPLCKLDYDILQEWALRIVRDRKMTKRSYYNMAIIWRQGLSYAVQKRIISENPFLSVKVDKKLFEIKRKPADATQVFLTSEQPLIEKEAYNDFQEREHSASLIIPFVFQTGLRLGEVVALKETDIHGDFIHIERMEVRETKKNIDGTWQPQHFIVVDYVKSEAGIRDVFLTSKAKNIITKVLAYNKERNLNDNGFLFLDKAGERIKSKSVDTRLRKYCRKIGIAEKGLHCERRTYISTLIDAQLNINEIRKLVGHESESTTYRSYCYNRLSRTETDNKIEQALGNLCVQA